MNRVAVIIPIYKTSLSEFDKISLTRTCKVLAAYPLIIIHPENLDISPVIKQYPTLKSQAFKPEFFEGIMGYNQMMLATEFYGAFLDYEYILICQTDAYIIKDELTYWCDKGYDYIGAPWLRRKVYDLPIMKQCMKISLWWKKIKGVRSKQSLYNKIGNGGLSLRKVRSHYEATKELASLKELYLNRRKKNHLFNEDVFWATEPKDFTYPSVNEALMFAFDKYPDYCYRLTGGQLPFGCHAWYKRKMHKFWEKKLPESFKIE